MVHTYKVRSSFVMCDPKNVVADMRHVAQNPLICKEIRDKNTRMRDLFGKFDQNVNNEGVSPSYKDVIFGGSMLVVSLSAFK